MKTTYSMGLGYYGTNRRERGYQLAAKAASEGETGLKAVGPHSALLELTARTWRSAGGMAFAMRRYEAAADHIGRAKTHYRTLLKSHPGTAAWKQGLNKALGYESLCWFKLKRPRKLVQLALEIRRLWVNDPQLFEAASNIATATTLIGNPGEPRTPAEQKEWNRLADLSIKILREAVDAGFNDVSKLRNDPGFRAIQDHPPFQRVLRQLSGANRKPVVARKPPSK